MNETLQNQANPGTYYYSTLASDPDLAEIVEMFIDEMPDRIAALKSEFETSNWEGLGRLAHQLKGAAGSYGFSQITSLAANLELAIRQSQGEAAVNSAYEQLTNGCSRIRPGSGK
jgi:HPt (histidine-containing phosphotransfer) domain-containing protein